MEGNIDLPQFYNYRDKNYFLDVFTTTTTTVDPECHECRGQCMLGSAFKRDQCMENCPTC